MATIVETDAFEIEKLWIWDCASSLESGTPEMRCRGLGEWWCERD